MEPEMPPPAAKPSTAPRTDPTTNAPLPENILQTALDIETEEYRGLRWIFIGPNGLRTGWSIALFFILSVLFIAVLGSVASAISRSLHHAKTGGFSPDSAIVGELISLLAIVGAAALVGILEHRRILDYNLTGPRLVFHFVAGLVTGVATLSVLVGAIAWGGWMQFGPAALSGTQIVRYAALWGGTFLVVGLFEEGAFRGYLQFTLTRGINFWWALGTVGVLCLYLLVTTKGNGVWGVYGFALLGVAPCLMLQVKKAATASFWQAAWVTSTLFGFIHTANNGENWIGIFAAAFVGFVFCVSIRLTGSAWWAIGCHAAWDWTETYLYGAADSGNVATGHFLTTNPVGNPLWSGGSDGPEGSLLILPIILLLLLSILAIYGRRGKSASSNQPVPNLNAG